MKDVYIIINNDYTLKNKKGWEVNIYDNGAVFNIRGENIKKIASYIKEYIDFDKKNYDYDYKFHLERRGYGLALKEALIEEGFEDFEEIRYYGVDV